jgi:hypothetical protein
MELELDKKRFQRFMELKYGISVIVNYTSPKPLTKNNKKIRRWTNAVCKYFGCTMDQIYTKTRKNNKYHSIWARYCISIHEGINDDGLGELFGVDRTTIAYDKKVCKGWVEVYPDVYNGILETAKQLEKPRKYKYDLQIKKIKL